jgi:hypothetical protein
MVAGLHGPAARARLRGSIASVPSQDSGGLGACRPAGRRQPDAPKPALGDPANAGDVAPALSCPHEAEFNGAIRHRHDKATVAALAVRQIHGKAHQRYTIACVSVIMEFRLRVIPSSVSTKFLTPQSKRDLLDMAKPLWRLNCLSLGECRPRSMPVVSGPPAEFGWIEAGGIAPNATACAGGIQAGLGALAIRHRSSWATAPSTCRENMPCGLLVSIGSRRLRKWAPFASSCSMTASRWQTRAR